MGGFFWQFLNIWLIYDYIAGFPFMIVWNWTWYSLIILALIPVFLIVLVITLIGFVTTLFAQAPAFFFWSIVIIILLVVLTIAAPYIFIGWLFLFPWDKPFWIWVSIILYMIFWEWILPLWKSI